MSRTISLPEAQWPKIGLAIMFMWALPMSFGLGFFFGDYLHHLIRGLTFGLVFSLCVTPFLRWSVRRHEARFRSQTPDFNGETLIVQGPANILERRIYHGGYMWLTSGRLHHEPLKRSARHAPWTVPLTDIAAAEPHKALGLFNSRLIIRLKSGEIQRFTVPNSPEWAASIQSALPK